MWFNFRTTSGKNPEIRNEGACDGLNHVNRSCAGCGMHGEVWLSIGRAGGSLYGIWGLWFNGACWIFFEMGLLLLKNDMYTRLLSVPSVQHVLFDVLGQYGLK